jgi:hypothetical protein
MGYRWFSLRSRRAPAVAFIVTMETKTLKPSLRSLQAKAKRTISRCPMAEPAEVR